MSIHTPICFLLGAFVLFSACKSDPPLPSANDLTGYWTVQKATRNNRETGTLAGTFFQFDSTGQMRTNLPSESEASEWIGPYSVNNRELLQQSEPSMVYQLQQVTDTSLQLGFSARGMAFTLWLRRSEPPLPDSTQTEQSPVTEDSTGL
jgi:hypothetical protein